MDQIRDYVDAMFSSLPDTDAVRGMKRSILENMQERYEELCQSGKNEKEALGEVISQFGNIDEIKKELGMEDSGRPQQPGILETFFAYFLPGVLFWRMLIHRSAAEAAVFFSAVGVYLMLGFTWNLWHPGWLIFQLGGLVILLLNRRKPARFDYKAEVQSNYGILETFFAYFSADVLFWRILIRRDAAEAVIFFSALAVHLLLGFTLNLWPVSWLAFWAAGAVILLRGRKRMRNAAENG